MSLNTVPQAQCLEGICIISNDDDDDGDIVAKSVFASGSLFFEAEFS